MDNFILKELLHTCKSSIKQTILLLLVSIVGILCMGMAIVLLIKTDNEVKEYQETYEEKQYYSILDDFSSLVGKDITYVLLYLFMVTIVLGIIPMISGIITFFKTDLIYYMKEEI